MDKITFDALTRIITGLLNDASSIRHKAIGLLNDADFSEPEFIQAAQAFLEKQEDAYIRDDMERRAAKLWESIKAARPGKTDKYKRCTKGPLHEWEELFDDFKMGKGRVTVRCCKCGAHHEEWWNDKERYLVRNWNAKEEKS